MTKYSAILLYLNFICMFSKIIVAAKMIVFNQTVPNRSA